MKISKSYLKQIIKEEINLVKENGSLISIKKIPDHIKNIELNLKKDYPVVPSNIDKKIQIIKNNFQQQNYPKLLENLENLKNELVQIEDFDIGHSEIILNYIDLIKYAIEK